MNIAKVVANIGTITELQRIASAYVIDYRNLTDEEVKQALIKTAPQYYFRGNVEKTLRAAFFHNNREIANLSWIILKRFLLQKDRFMCPKRELEDDILAWEQSVVDKSNEDLFRRGGSKGKCIELLRFLIETAWQNNDAVSPDERNLIEKVKERLRISDRDYRLIEAKLGKFPKPENLLHTRTEIDEARRYLQKAGIMFSIRDDDGSDFDVIPDEIATTLRELLGLEVRDHGYKELLRSKHVRSKAYLLETLEKCGVDVDGANTLEELQGMVLEQVRPSVVLGGTSPKDGLDMETLARWCADLELPVSGMKAERIQRLLNFYDNLMEKDEDVSDDREISYKLFTEFANRNIQFLRAQQLIEKDIEIERCFENATSYLFEKRFHHKPLTLVGSNHADGAISFKDGLIFWDNKSKESPVNLKDHIRQFDSYIKAADKKVFAFLVVGPEFTQESSTIAMQYLVENRTTLTLITAAQLKTLAEQWHEKNNAKNGSQDPFPLGYLIQPGKFNMDLVAAL